MGCQCGKYHASSVLTSTLYYAGGIPAWSSSSGGSECEEIFSMILAGLIRGRFGALRPTMWLMDPS